MGRYVTMALAEARQRSERLRRDLVSESFVRDREGGECANGTEIIGCQIAEEDFLKVKAADEVERANLESITRNDAKLRAAVFCSIDETCFPGTESNMRKFPIADHPALQTTVA